MSALDYKYEGFSVDIEVMFERTPQRGKPDELTTPTVQCISTVRVYAHNVAEAAENATAMFMRDVRVSGVVRS